MASSFAIWYNCVDHVDQEAIRAQLLVWKKNREAYSTKHNSNDLSCNVIHVIKKTLAAVAHSMIMCRKQLKIATI